jgi:PhnB protein
MATVKPIPDGYPSLTPYLIVADGAAAIAFYEKAFGARLRLSSTRPAAGSATPSSKLATR